MSVNLVSEITAKAMALPFELQQETLAYIESLINIVARRNAKLQLPCLCSSPPTISQKHGEFPGGAPRTAAGKIRMSLLRAWYWQGQEKRVN